MGSRIIGSGIAVPDRIVTNHDLARIMDTSDEWIQRRTGVAQRHFVEPGVGSSDLGAAAARNALDDASIAPGEVDAIVTATMTPDSFAPGIAATVQHELGLDRVPAYDIRQQCSGFLYALDLADALIGSGRARTVLAVGAEVHSGFLPWEGSWPYLYAESDDPIPAEQYERNTRYRDWSVLFGDGAGAAVLRTGPESEGFLASSLHSDGSQFDLIQVPGVGFDRRPYVDVAQIEACAHLPTMRGRELFRTAVTAMPESVHEVLEAARLSATDVDLVIAHQANARIVEAVRKALGLEPEKVPVNIDRYANTTAGTLPILFHEMRAGGRVPPGALICFTAFGAGAHWGAMLYREPRSPV